MGRAIVRDPQAFLFDEPLSNLDAKLRVQMRTEIARVQKKYGTTTVYVTHDQTEAMTLATGRGAEKGVVQQVDSPRNLYNSPPTCSSPGFIGSPSMNLSPATAQGPHSLEPCRSATFELPDELVASLLAQRSEESLRTSPGILPVALRGALRWSRREDRRVRRDVPQAASTSIEWMGSELYAYLPYQGGDAIGRQLDQLAGDLDMEQATGDESQIVARLDAASRVREGEEAEIWLDARKIHLFDPEDGQALARPAVS
jgi:multiple sugar transport system ATP-binding protein